MLKEKKTNRKKGKYPIRLVLTLILALLASVVMFTPIVNLLTGWTTSAGSLSITVESSNKTITIHYPTDGATIYYAPGSNYSVDLNVSANWVPEWWNFSVYSHYQDKWLYKQVNFTPNTTFVGARYKNTLYVGAVDDLGIWYTETVSFNISVPNTAPFIDPNTPNETLGCEGQQLSFKFNGTDPDDQNLTGGIDPTNPFFIRYSKNYPPNVTEFEVYSGVLNKSHIGTTEVNISVTDPDPYIDWKRLNITVIEINNNVTIEDVISLTASTVNGTPLVYQFQANDVENGNSSSGNLTFSLTYANGSEFTLFKINKTHGIINFTANSSTPVQNYSLMVCVNDTGLSSPHPNISLCAPAQPNMTKACDNFTLIITNLTSTQGPLLKAGDGAITKCSPQWAKENPTENCRNLEDERRRGNINEDDYLYIKEQCKRKNIIEACGFVSFNVIDLARCLVNGSSYKDKPKNITACYYTESPSCTDGIRNSHDGRMELGIDCGGPCPNPCATCTDGIKNGGEEGIDCGGPCPNACVLEKPSKKLPKQFYLLILTILLLIYILVKLITTYNRRCFSTRNK